MSKHFEGGGPLVEAVYEAYGSRLNLDIFAYALIGIGLAAFVIAILAQAISARAEGGERPRGRLHRPLGRISNKTHLFRL